MTHVRNEIPAKYKWDLTGIYSTEAEFEADYERAKAYIADFPRHRDTMTKSAKGLYEALQASIDLDRVITKLYEFAFLSSDLDKSDNKYLALSDRIMNLANEANSASFFLSPMLVKIKDKTLDTWYAEVPALEEFRRTIDLSRRYRKYTLSDDKEQLLADIGICLGTNAKVEGIFSNADLPFGKIRDEEGKLVELTDSTYVLRLTSKDRRVRRAAFKKLYETYKQFGNTFAALLGNTVKERTTLAKIRGFGSSIEASTFNDEVTPVIYNNLIDTVNRNMQVIYSYFNLKKEVLGLPALHMYDLYTPLIPDCTKEYSFDEAVDTVIDTVRILGDEYADTLEDGIKNKSWVDVYPTKGKRGGAYSAGCYDTQPYILLNYNEKIDDVSTLAHEAGHSMHSYYSCKNNTPQDSNYTIFVAEVASTVNELLFCHKKLRESNSREEKLSILNQLMETYKGTLYRQTMFAEFERDIHAMTESGATLTQELLCNTYYNIVKKYFGTSVVCDKEISMEWMRIPHFYRSFYVYKYATCISAASAIVRRIENEGEAYIGKYLEFLSCGGRISPLDSLKVAGIDMSDPSVVDAAITDFAEAIAMFRELY
ncbi:MAG: oligoendopeptidase F [Ruminococcaceae bacterium]|nr:oligoendopeptidase F [Oscillospiraceae bacterium]